MLLKLSLLAGLSGMHEAPPPTPSANGPEPRASKRLVQARDADEQALGLAPLDQSYQQLSSGKFSGSLFSATVDDVTVFRETLNQSVYQTGHSDARHITIAVACELSEQAYWNGRHIGEDAVVAFAPGREFELRTPSHAVCVGISLPPGMLHSLAPDLSAEHWVRHFAAMDCWMDGGSAKSALASRLEAALSDPSESESEGLCAEVRDLTELTIDYLAGVLDRQPASGPKLRADSYPRIARRARAVMIERMGEPISISDLCNELGCSRRALQYAFESIFDVKPVAYLRTLRLAAARKALTANRRDTTVQDVAAAVGFAHLPRFAKDYARMYGEKPSETLLWRR